MTDPQLQALKAKAALADRLLVALEDLYNALMAPASAANVDALAAARHAAVLVMIDANPKKPEYNGWANRATWNVALWISNDERNYEIARGFKHKPQPYKGFAVEVGSFATPDGVSWTDETLDIAALDAMIGDL